MSKKHEKSNLELLVEQLDLAQKRLGSALWELESVASWYWGNRRQKIRGLAEDIESL